MSSRGLVLLVKPAIERFPKVSRFFRVLRDSLSPDPEFVKTPWGFEFIGNYHMSSGTYEPEETRTVVEALRDSEILINIGANVGYYCCIARSMGKPVIAFEPLEANLYFLYKNLRANGWDSDVEVYPTALGDRVGLVDLYGGGGWASTVRGWHGIAPGHVRTVPSTTLDNVLGDRLLGKKCLFVIDVEGGEKNVLAGAQRELERSDGSTWLVEIAVAKNQPAGVAVNPNLEATFEAFWSRGYRAFTVSESPRELLAPEVAEVARSGIDTLKSQDFLFKR